MVLSISQQVALAFTAVLFMFVVLPRLLGVGMATKETKLDPRFNRKGWFFFNSRVAFTQPAADYLLNRAANDYVVSRVN